MLIWTPVADTLRSGPYEIRKEAGFWQCSYAGHLLFSRDDIAEAQKIASEHAVHTREYMEGAASRIREYNILFPDSKVIL
jgi:hypothetical protein